MAHGGRLVEVDVDVLVLVEVDVEVDVVVVFVLVVDVVEVVVGPVTGTAMLFTITGGKRTPAVAATCAISRLMFPGVTAAIWDCTSVMVTFASLGTEMM